MGLTWHENISLSDSMPFILQDFLDKLKSYQDIDFDAVEAEMMKNIEYLLQTQESFQTTLVNYLIDNGYVIQGETDPGKVILTLQLTEVV